VIRFLHTSDWQLGMTRHFLSEGAQERYSQARFDAIRTMGRVTKEEGCGFMLVCGDTFESNQVDRKTVARALEALKEVPVPVFILPGNHDPLNAAAVYRSSTFIDRKPAHVHVIESVSPVQVAEGVELIGAPWLSKRPFANPIEDALGALASANGITRIIEIQDALSKQGEVITTECRKHSNMEAESLTAPAPTAAGRVVCLECVRPVCLPAIGSLCSRWSGPPRSLRPAPGPG